MKIHANDMALVIKGRDRGKRGRVTRVNPKMGKAVVEGVNVAKRHQKPAGAFRAGGIIEKELPIPVANLKFYCEICDSPVKIGFRVLADRSKARICKKCGEVIE